MNVVERGVVQMINLTSMNLYRLQMELNAPFQTSFGTVRMKDFFLFEAIDISGERGYGETVAFTFPWYTEETTETVVHIIERFIIPLLQNKKIKHPDDLLPLFQTIKRNNMAKAAVEGAI